MNALPRQELTALTSLRGIAAVLVMLHHFTMVVLKDLVQASPTSLIPKSYLWVDLFFILSGFVLAYGYHTTFHQRIQPGQYLRFIQARFARIYPLHLFMLMLFVAYESLQWLLSDLGAQGMSHVEAPFTKGQSLYTLKTNLLLIQTIHWRAYWNEPAWSISAEWMIYFTLPFLIAILFRLRSTWILPIAALAIIPLIIIETYFGDLGLYYAGWPMLIRCACEAILGILAYRCYQLGLFSHIASVKLLTPALILNLVLLALPGPGVPSVIGFAWLVLCASRLQQHQPHFLNTNWVVYMGSVSYSIYLVHWLILDIVKDGARFLTGVPADQALTPTLQGIMLIIMVGLTFGISHLTYRYIENPMRKRLKPSSKKTRSQSEVRHNIDS
ncbi:acyltransferase family protein [Marinobacter sp.]|uniref:acyltransferase family protein n=1 Tax=Marinobacter sp. TaxID=50741 RepID=UPI0034A172FF